MKKLIGVLAIWLVVAGVAYGQATRYQPKVSSGWVLLDNNGVGTADTVNLAIPSNRGKGYPKLRFLPETVKASSQTDSLKIRYRPAFGIQTADTFANCTWKTLQTYTCGGANVSVDGTFDWADSLYYIGIVDMDGLPWDYIQIEAWWRAYTTDDSAKVWFWLDQD